MVNNFFASVFSDFKGYNVAIFEIDKTNENPVFLLHHSESSDMLAIEPIADSIKPFAGDEFMGCYFNFVEHDTVNLIPNGVIAVVGGRMVLTRVNENPEVSLTSLTVKINTGFLKIKSHLAGRIQSDLKNTDIDDMSHQIANLTHVADNWDMLAGKSNIEIRSSGTSRTSVTDSLDGFLGVDRYYR